MMELEGKVVKTCRFEGTVFTFHFTDGTEFSLEPGVQPTGNGHYRLALGLRLTTSVIPEFPQSLITEPSYAIQCRGNHGNEEQWADLPRDVLSSQIAAYDEARKLSLHVLIYGQVRVIDKKTGFVHKLFIEGVEVEQSN